MKFSTNDIELAVAASVARDQACVQLHKHKLAPETGASPDCSFEVSHLKSVMNKALLTVPPLPGIEGLVSLQLLPLVWGAGFVDAEACIRIHKRKVKDGSNAIFSLEVTISQNRLQTLAHFRDMLGIKGSIYACPIKRKVRRTVHALTYRCTCARQVLELLLPYLVRKREEALLAIEFARHVSCARLGRRRHPPEEIRLREDYCERMKALK